MTGSDDNGRGGAGVVMGATYIPGNGPPVCESKVEYESDLLNAVICKNERLGRFATPPPSVATPRAPLNFRALTKRRGW
jgi:hypothetical protein